MRDPLAAGSRAVGDFYRLGKSLRAYGLPMFSLLKGGYSRDLPELIFACLRGIKGI